MWDKAVYWLRKFWKDENAATAVEYGIIASMVGIASLVALTAFGNQVVAIFEGVTGTMRDHLS